MSAPGGMEQALTPFADPAWLLETHSYDPLRESSRASRFSVSNGFLGVRGMRAVSRGEQQVIPARTYVAGLFDTPGRGQSVPVLIPAPDWLRVRLLLAGGPLVHHPSDLAAYRMTLDKRRGMLLTDARLVAPDLAISLRSLRLVSRAEPALGLQLLRLGIEAGSTAIALEASFEGMHFGLVAEHVDRDIGIWRTRHSAKRVAIAASARLWIDGREIAPAEHGPMHWRWTWSCHPEQIVEFERIVAVVRSDTPERHPGEAAQHTLSAARHRGWRGVVARHQDAWAERWQRSDVEVDGDAPAQQALRFALYHLNGAANPADPQVSIGARALTGDDYHGHVFWDTEIYLLPFYTMTWPEAARALLMYRYRTLDAAREKATRMGWRGALYAWESTDTGAEATPDQVVGPDRRVVDVLCGHQEQHISADIAYAVWQYWEASGDEAFLRDAGAEILCETARFWVSRAQLEPDGRRHIRGVIGPDEYHETIDDNAFTNVMARRNIRRALDAIALLRARWPGHAAALATRIGLDEAELQLWPEAAETIATGRQADSGLFEQFEGYFALEDIDLSLYAGRTVPMDVVLGRERTQNSQVVKQADVVALLGLLPDEFPGAAAAANYRYYAKRCSHGSSLSAAMHGLAAARLGETAAAMEYFHHTAAIDLADTHVAIDGGVHIAGLGGMWLMTVFGFAGLALRDDGLALAPRLPATWQGLAFAVEWRGRRLRIRITREARAIEATLLCGAPMMLHVDGTAHALNAEMALGVPVAGLV